MSEQLLVSSGDRRTGGLLSITLPVGIGITWFLSQNQNPGTISLVLLLMALFVSVEPRELVLSWKRSRVVLLLLGCLILLGLATTLVAGGGLLGLRTAALAAFVFVLGLVMGTTVGIRVLLLGLLVGATLVLMAGWSKGLDRLEASAFFTLGLYPGLTESQPTEFFTVLVGFGALLALSRPRIRSLLSWSPLFLLFLATAFYLGLIVSWLVTGCMVAVWAVLTVLTRLNSRRLDHIFGWGATVVFLLGAAGLAIRPLASGIALLHGDKGSLDARFVIWHSVRQTINFPGFLFGYGASFWGDGSPYGDAARDKMEIGITGFHPGVGRFAHAHSGYLDFLIAFGLVGSVLGIVLVITFVRKVVQGWFLRGSWEARSAPWIYGAALAVMGLTESAMIQNSTGWLFSGMLVGAFVIADPYSRRGVDPETEAVRIASCSDSAREDRG